MVRFIILFPVCTAMVLDLKAMLKDDVYFRNGIVPYQFDASLPQMIIDRIKIAFDVVSTASDFCLNFTETKQLSSSRYIYFNVTDLRC